MSEHDQHAACKGCRDKLPGADPCSNNLQCPVCDSEEFKEVTKKSRPYKTRKDLTKPTSTSILPIVQLLNSPKEKKRYDRTRLEETSSSSEYEGDGETFHESSDSSNSESSSNEEDLEEGEISQENLEWNKAISSSLQTLGYEPPSNMSFPSATLSVNPDKSVPPEIPLSNIPVPLGVPTNNEIRNPVNNITNLDEAARQEDNMPAN